MSFEKIVISSLEGLGFIILYYLSVASLCLLLNKIFHFPKAVFRKILHMICLGSVFIYYYFFDTWYIAIISIALFCLLAFIALQILKNNSNLSNITSEKKKGELRTSLLLVHLMFSILIIVFFWLLEDYKYIFIVGTLAWGPADAAAALVGKRFGKKHLSGKLIEGTKSIEGTIAMGVVSLIYSFFALLVYASVPIYYCLMISLVVGVVSAFVELFSKWGMDTFTVPIISSFLVYGFIILFNQVSAI